MNRKTCEYQWLGRVEYEVAWELQKSLVEARAEGRVDDTLLLLEHPPTYTLGRHGKEAHLLVSRDTLEGKGVKVLHVDRGGDITFHGPGQLVGYPVLDLRAQGKKPVRYVRDLEETLIKALSWCGVKATRLENYPGVWVGEKKIAAIGVRVSVRGITSHGFALNVMNDLNYFSKIVPCGIPNKGVTSLTKVLGSKMAFSEVQEKVALSFGEVFGMTMLKTSCQFTKEPTPKRCGAIRLELDSAGALY